MPAILPPTANCCTPCDDAVVTQVPGPAGADGADGTDGTDGENAFTLTTDDFVMPAIAADVVVEVADSDWAVVGQVVFIQTAGYFTVQTKTDSTHMTVRNLGYTGNAAPTTNILTGKAVGPGGLKGVDGAGTTVTLDSISPTTSLGDLMVDDGANSPAASVVRKAVGADGTLLTADSGDPTGVAWNTLDLTGPLSGQLPVASGGTGAANAAGAATNLAVLPLAGGTLTGDVLVSKSVPKWVLYASDRPLNEKRWLLESILSAFAIAADTDAGGAPVIAFSISRTGVTPGTAAFSVIVDMALALRLTQYLQLLQGTNTALANGANADVALGNSGYLKIKAGPTGAFSISGITGGVNGRILILQNATGQNMTLNNENALSTALNRIVTGTGADFVSTGDCVVKLIYDLDAQRWQVVSTQG